jgi:four helix bundle protein
LYREGKRALSFELERIDKLKFWIRVMAESLIQKKSFEFSLEIIRLYKRLQIQREFVLSNQLLRSGTSIGANVEEASAGQSRKDFVAKMCIAAKEARETRY